MNNVKTKARILRTARSLIEKKDFEEFRIEDLLNSLKLSKGGFYHYFKSRDKLLAELIIEDLQSQLDSIASIAKNENPKIAIIKIFDISSIENDLGILRFLRTKNSRFVYLNLMDSTWYSPLKLEFKAILERGTSLKIFSDLDSCVVSEIFEAINRHADRSTILGLWSNKEQIDFSRYSIQLLATTLQMKKEFNKFLKLKEMI